MINFWEKLATDERTEGWTNERVSIGQTFKVDGSKKIFVRKASEM